MPPATDSESDYFDDDDFVVRSTPDGDAEASRPAKRRRVQRGDDDQDGSSETDAFSDIEEEVWTESFDQYEKRDSRSKSKSFVPKQNNVQENIFVTQLTQPNSSPERIRGPRWRKPSPKSPAPEGAPPTLQANATARQSNNFYDEEEELRAALAASLDAFEEEQTMRGAVDPAISSKTGDPQSTVADSKATPMDVSFELDDIPEDAFDSSPSLSPVSRPPQTPTFQSSAARPRNQPQNLRQTTIFGMAARNPDPPQQRERDWAPPEKTEPPTQHKLNQDTLTTWWYPTNLGTIRDYQFNIAQKGLFHNLLVALPTGLGKTFIAATIMLNWFRWTQDAQIIFVAPTKPLVSQQVSACLDIAGIPRSQSTMLTGGAAPGIRAEEWQAKRVFFMTPQTLMNDLKTGIADPKRIVLLVVDEAHRATGGYAYVEVVKFLRRYNKSVRVLALTATPGSTVESVQAVIDGLDISRVEIRTEHSLDIRDYVHSRNIDVETFLNSDEMVFCMDLLSTTLRPLVDQLRTLNAYWGRDPMSLTAYGLTKARQQWMASDAGRNAGFGLKGKVNAIFTVLASLAHAIDLLKYHGIVPFFRHLLHFKSNTDGNKGGKWQKEVVGDESFKKLMSHLEPWSKNPEFIGHPKLEYLKSVILNHFMDAGEGKDSAVGDCQTATRVMIFVHFRDSAEEVVRVLKRYEPMIRPHVFVGQSSAKGSEGMDQKTQLKIIENFKKGTYNTIVATSIGEEGLDIGEVDRIVCYDSSASPIRMLQRMGRTGRKRAGNITLLLMQGKEEESYLKAKDNYEKMQQMIASGSRFTFHDDRSARILPPGVRPVADKRLIDIPSENSQQEHLEPKRRGRAPKRPPKKFHMPDDVETGFTRASTLDGNSSKTETSKAKASKAEKKKTPKKGVNAPDQQVKTPKQRVRKPTPEPEPVDIPLSEEVVLNKNELQQLGRLYQRSGDASPGFIRNPRIDAFPRLQRVARPTKAVQHGSLTRRMVSTLQKMDEARSDRGDRFQQILAQEAAKIPADFKAKRRRKSKATNSSKEPHSRKKPRLVSADGNAEESRLLSPNPSDSEPVRRQPSPGRESDSGDDLPDPNLLFSSGSKPKARKPPRTIVDSDDS